MTGLVDGDSPNVVLVLKGSVTLTEPDDQRRLSDVVQFDQPFATVAEGSEDSLVDDVLDLRTCPLVMVAGGPFRLLISDGVTNPG